ncbi:MAG: peptidylprolyl isomerase [Proteobacteria bacterium]|nr:peptidylprolyl isomerase [Pseudomonadota bacterium]
MQVRRILREPLLHFLLLGLALFAYYGRVAPDDDGKRRIVVTQADVDLLATQFQGTWNRPPSPVELHGLVDSYVRDEILYREGVALGLDRDDAVIKRRVRQKLDVLFEESVAQNPATDADLQAYRDANPAAFRKPAVVSFDQIFFGSDAVTPQRLEQARAALARGADPGTLGQATLLPSRQDAMPIDLIARDFGEKFAAQLANPSHPASARISSASAPLSQRSCPRSPTCATSSPANGRTSGASRRMRMRSQNCGSNTRSRSRPPCRRCRHLDRAPAAPGMRACAGRGVRGTCDGR